MNERILICIPICDRMRIAEYCIPTITTSADPADNIVLCDDGSKETMPYSLKQEADVILSGSKIGIENHRRRHFKMMEENPHFTHLYLTDADALHDPEWRKKLLDLQASLDGMPVCGYNTLAHENLVGNTLEMHFDRIIRIFAPGVSYLLTRTHCEKISSYLKTDSRAHWDWDWTVPAILGHRFAISRPSYVDHIGFGGMHHPEKEGYDAGDRAVDPTPWLVKKRAEIVKALTNG